MKKLLTFFCLAFMFVAGVCLVQTMPAVAYAETTATESAYAKVYVNDMTGVAVDGATYDAQTGNITNVAAYGRFGFNANYENVEVTSTVNFSTAGNTAFILRAQGSTLTTVNNDGWTNKGYVVRWYPHGQFEFFKNGTLVSGPFWGPLPAMATGTDYTVVFKTVNMSDGSVQVLLTINGSVVLNHNDATNPITGGGWYAMCSEGSVFSATGSGMNTPIVNLNDADPSPVGSSNFAGATVDANGVVTTGAGANSGVGYTFYANGGYGYKVKVTPSAAAGALIFTIGSYKTNAHEMNRPDQISSGAEGWGWDEPGYVMYWYSNGQRHLARGPLEATRKDYVWNAPAFVAGQTYEVEFSMEDFDDGSVRVIFKVNGSIICNFLDRPTDTYTPVKVVNANSALGRISNVMLISQGVSTQFSPVSTVSVTPKTVITNQMGTGSSVINAVTFDRNGAVENFAGNTVIGYNTDISTSSVKFKANFSTIGSGFTALLNYQGSLDQTWGGGWTSMGYGVKFYPNGMVGFIKNGAVLFEGWNPWAFAGVGLTTSTDYNFEVGAITVGNAVRIFAKINDAEVLNFLDTNDPIIQTGWFAIHSEGFAGSIKASGIEYPVVQTDIASGEKVAINVPVQLSIVDANGEESVVYYVDETKSTATANIEGSVITPLTEGDLVVYAKVDGLYSEDLTFGVEQPAHAVVTNLPTQPIIVGGDVVSVDGKMSDDSQIKTKEFSIENVSGKATINATTGEINPLAAGTVKVFVTINGLKSEGNIVTIIPKVEIKNSTAMAVGQTLDTLGYLANCNLPNEMIVATYELTEGSEIVELNTSTGAVRALAVGIFGVRVTLTGETFQAVSTVCRISVEPPVVVINDGPVNDMFVGQTITLNPHISQGGVEITSREIIVTQGANCVEVNGVQIKAIKVGTVRIKAKVNGIEGLQESEFAITELVPTIIVANMPFGRTQNLSVMFNSDDFEYTQIVYSIVEGQDHATIDGNILSGVSAGRVRIKAVIDEIFTAYAYIDITQKLILTGVTNGQDVVVGSEIQLGYFVYDDTIESPTTVQYILVDGSEYAELSETGVLKVKKEGKIKIKVVVDGEESQIISIDVYKKDTKLDGYYSLIWKVGVPGLLGIGGLSIGGVYLYEILKNKKSKKQSTDTEETKEDDNKGEDK